MEPKRTVWNTVDKSYIRLEALMEEYLMVCQTENKSIKTVRGYREKLERFSKWIDGTLDDFHLRSTREYIGMLQRVRKYESHPSHPTQDSGLSSVTIKLIFSRLAKSSGVSRLHAHLCRHTFAINYLLNGGDIFSLKAILGHTSFDMVNHYLHFTSTQITAQHHKYSPMDKLHEKNE